MPDIGALHPQVVHFVVALGLLGVLFRLLSLTGRMSWTNQAAATLMILCAGASVLAVESGTDTHDNAERIPGVRQAVMEHEDWGHYTRNVLLGVAGLELLGLIFGSSGAGRVLRYLSAGGGLVAGAFIVKVADLGGDIVYEYAGGVGTRSGDPEDLGHPLVAGPFYRAPVARGSGRGAGGGPLPKPWAPCGWRGSSTAPGWRGIREERRRRRGSPTSSPAGCRTTPP